MQRNMDTAYIGEHHLQRFIAQTQRGQRAKPAELVPTYSMRESDMGCGNSSKSRLRVLGAAATESRILQFSANAPALTTNSRQHRQLELGTCNRHWQLHSLLCCSSSSSRWLSIAPAPPAYSCMSSASLYRWLSAGAGCSTDPLLLLLWPGS